MPRVYLILEDIAFYFLFILKKVSSPPKLSLLAHLGAYTSTLEKCATQSSRKLTKNTWCLEAFLWLGIPRATILANDENTTNLVPPSSRSFLAYKASLFLDRANFLRHWVAAMILMLSKVGKNPWLNERFLKKVKQYQFTPVSCTTVVISG